MASYTLTDAHRNIAEIVNKSRYTNRPVTITDHGKPAAIVVSPQLMARYQALEDAADSAELEAIAARGPVWLSDDEAQRLLNEIDAEAAAQGT